MRKLEKRCSVKLACISPAHVALAVLVAVSLLIFAPAQTSAQSIAPTLPDAPSTLLFGAYTNAQQATQTAGQKTAPSPPQIPPLIPPQTQLPFPAATAPPSIQNSPITPPQLPQPAPLPPCPDSPKNSPLQGIFLPASTQPSCQRGQLHPIVNAGQVRPLTSEQKGFLALHAVTDPFNVLSIAGFSAIAVAANAHSAYGPGFAGWGRLSGYSLAEDVQGEFVGTYLIPSLVHEDPRYHRMPGAPISRRFEHALLHTFVSQHDDGSAMPNYATLLNAPISAEISNLYVPGIATNGPSTVKRVMVTYGTDPIGPLIAEFLPDIARRIHVNILFEQQLLNRIALGSGAQSAP